MIKFAFQYIYLLIPLAFLPAEAGKNDQTQTESWLIDNVWREESVASSQMAIGRESGIIRFIYGKIGEPVSGDAQTAAVQYIIQLSTKLGVDNIEKQLHLNEIRTSPGGTHVVYRQFVQDVPVYDSDIIITMDRQGQITFVASNFHSELDVIPVPPEISADDALNIARTHIDMRGKYFAQPETELMILQTKNGAGRLVFRVRIATSDPRGDWQVFVDALTAVVIHVENRIMYDEPVTGTGAVFLPDPLRSAGVFYGGAYTDPQGLDLDTDALNDQRILVELNEITRSGDEYRLSGPYVELTDMEDPTDDFPVLSHPDSFIFLRSEQEFEHVMVYYHIDRAYRYLQSIGFEVNGLLRFRADPHGAAGQDNSYYIGGQANFCSFGEGGVDDAEDGAVIWHEYAHAIQENIVPGGMRYTGETKSLQEGSSDYWAASFNRAVTEFAWQNVFLWDPGITDLNGPGMIWAGRRVDTDMIYPADYDTRPDREHLNGQIWSSAMMHIREDLGRDMTDKIFIQAHYLWGSAPGLRDAARAVLQADSLLYNGLHTADIVYWFQHHGLLDKKKYIPVIMHTPLSDTEDLAGPYAVQIIVSDGKTGPDPDQMWLYYQFDGGQTDSVLLNSGENAGEFRADIPGPGQSAQCSYYISLRDSLGTLVRDPWQAPLEKYYFYCGPDTLAPVIQHQALTDHAFREWPAKMEVHARDNLGIESVQIRFYVNTPANIDSFYLEFVNGDYYSGYFPLAGDQLSVGDSVFYQLVVRDIALKQNFSHSPEQGYHRFEMLPGGGRIIISIEDGPSGFTASGDWEWGIPYNGPPDFVSGTRVWATNLLGPYSQGPVTSTLQTTEFDLYGFEHVSMKIWHWFEIEHIYDGGNIKVSADSGHTWEPAIPSTGYFTIVDQQFNNPMARQAAFSGNSDQWVLTCINLDKFSGQKIQVRFDFGSDITNTLSGWYIDSLLIVDEETTVPTPLNLQITDNKDAITLIWDELRPTKSSPDTKMKIPDLYQIADQTQITSDWANLPVYYIYKRSHGNPFSRVDSVSSNTYKDSLVTSGIAYTYYLAFSNGETVGLPTDTVSATVEPVTSRAEKYNVPQEYALRQNYPNPFNPSTTIEYHLAAKSDVFIDIFDILGRKVRSMNIGSQEAGVYTTSWDGKDNFGKYLSSGLFFYKISTAGFSKTMKMLLLR